MSQHSVFTPSVGTSELVPSHQEITAPHFTPDRMYHSLVSFDISSKLSYCFPSVFELVLSIVSVPPAVPVIVPVEVFLTKIIIPLWVLAGGSMSVIVQLAARAIILSLYALSIQT